MLQNLRQTMAWLHTWFGLVLGFVLMVAFFFGALSVFDREFDRWTQPATRFEPQPMPSFDKVLRPVFESIVAPDPEELAAAESRVGAPLPARLTASEWSAYTTHRDPVLETYVAFDVPNSPLAHDHAYGHLTIDPRDGSELNTRDLKVGSGFFYPMHFSLHLEWKELGYWLVALAALTMLVALVSGVVIHRKLLRELFTFRPDRLHQRAVLDLHNLTGVVALPFHFLFAFTGLVIFAGIYFPVTETQLRRLHDAHERIEAEHTGLPHDPAGVAVPLASVDAMVRHAQARWAARGMAGEVGLLYLAHVGDANGYVSVYRAGTDRIALTGQGIHYRAADGELIREDPPESAVATVNEFLTGLHLQHFRHWLLRFLYVFGGLAGCVCIATGFLFFVEKRKAQHARSGVGGARLVDALGVTTVTGMVIATLVILVANHLGLAPVQEWCFWLGWVAAGIHAFIRTRPVLDGQDSPAWLEQCLAIGVLALAAPVLNWLSTDDHLLATLSRGYWPVAGIDLALLITSAGAFLVARRLRRRASVLANPEPVNA